MVVLIWVLNFVFSLFNAWSVGRAWTDSKAVGGWPRFVVWCGAVMSACGFIWCYTILEAFGLQSMGYLDEEQMIGLLSLGYLIIILPILGSGLGITIHSWQSFARRRSIGNAIGAGWNTFAQIHNTYRAVQGIPAALEGVGKLFSGRGSSRSRSNGKGAGGLAVVLLVLLAVVLGVLTTYAIIRKTANAHARSIGDQIAQARKQVKDAPAL